MEWLSKWLEEKIEEIHNEIESLRKGSEESDFHDNEIMSKIDSNIGAMNILFMLQGELKKHT
jgi:hypothetical protein